MPYKLPRNAELVTKMRFKFNSNIIESYLDSNYYGETNWLFLLKNKIMIKASNLSCRNTSERL